MTDADYELLPHQVIGDLKDEVEALKKRLSAPDTKINELILEIETLKDGIHELNTIFSRVLQEIKGDDDVHDKKVQEIAAKVDSILAQNETIAKGMVAIADKVDDFINSQGGMNSQGSMRSRAMSNQAGMSPMGPPMGMSGSQFNMGMPPMPGPGRMAPPPNFNDLPPLTPQSASDDDFPPPPPGLADKKRSLGGIFK